jgi:predicted Zn-dependent protease
MDLTGKTIIPGLVGMHGWSLDEAQESARKFIALYPTSTNSHFMYALVLRARGEPQAALSELEREDRVQFLDVTRPIVLDALGRHGDADRAIYWLDRAYRQNDGRLEWLKVDPLLKSLHGDRRYRALLQKMNFPD